MKNKEYDVAILGGGFSGLVAAGILKDHDLDILIIDEYNRLGGQYLKTHPILSNSDIERNSLQEIGFRQIENIEGGRVKIMTRTRVLEINDRRELLLEHDLEQLFALTPEIILLAAGAREKFVPFKGWTLPGVISTGAVQIMMKGSGVIPAEDMIIGGSGLFLYTVASEVIANGGRVSTIYDENSRMQKMSFTKNLIGQGEKLKEGFGQAARILFSPTRMRHRHRIVEARGEDQLEEISVAKVDRLGAVIPESERVQPCECLAVGNGFAANIELGLLAGCSPEYDADKGGWVIATAENFETSVPGVFAAGEITGVGGALKSITEGKLAAFSILNKLGKIDDSQYADETRSIRKERKRHLQFGSAFNALTHLSPEKIISIPDDTILCRCEDITMGQVKDAIAAGCRTPVAVKRATRTGMGICQGRICTPVLYEIIGTITRTPVHELKPLSVRGPVKAIPLEVLAKPISPLQPDTSTVDEV